MALGLDRVDLPSDGPGELLSFDVTFAGNTIAVRTDALGTFVAFPNGTTTNVPTRERHLLIAADRDDLAAVVATRSPRGTPNGWVVSPAGVCAEFFAGDAINELLALRNGHFVATYFDEGFAKPISEEGAAVFDDTGRLVNGYRQATGDSIMECYAAVAVGADSIALWPYPAWRLTIWNTNERTTTTHLVPGTVRGANAITHAGNRWWFWSPYNKRDHLFHWRLGSSKVEPVGRLEGPLRGRPGARFLIESPHNPAIVDIN